MKNSDIKTILDKASEFNLDGLRQFLTSDSERPLIAVGSGGMRGVADYAALLYGARNGLARAMTPLDMNSLSDETLSRVKILLLSKGGHNNDIEFAARRCLSVNPEKTACMCLYSGEKNKLRPLFAKAGASQRDFRFDCDIHDGFVSSGSPLMYVALLARVFEPSLNTETMTSSMALPGIESLSGISHFTILHGSWGLPVAGLLEGKFVESGWASGQVSDLRNYCHGRFIFTSNHLDDSAVLMLLSPREKELSARIRKFLPEKTKVVTIETDYDSPSATLDLLVQSSLLFGALCEAADVNPDSPSNPGKIDKRVPISIPFVSELKKSGPLKI